MLTNPYAASRYIKPIEGTIRVRIFDYIDYYQYWKNAEGEVVARGELGGPGSKPVRLRKDELMDQPMEVKNAVTPVRSYKVYNSETERAEILEIKQRTIIEGLIGLFYDEDWGEGKGLETFDVTITGTGKGKERRYSIVPKPPKGEFTKKMEPVNLEALYTNDDPFESTATVAEETPEQQLAREIEQDELSLDDVLDEL